jgi:hypothetical protein
MGPRSIDMRLTAARCGRCVHVWAMVLAALDAGRWTLDAGYKKCQPHFPVRVTRDDTRRDGPCEGGEREPRNTMPLYRGLPLQPFLAALPAFCLACHQGQIAPLAVRYDTLRTNPPTPLYRFIFASTRCVLGRSIAMFSQKSHVVQSNEGCFGFA